MKNRSNDSMGKRLEEARKSISNLTQGKLGECFGVTKGSISKWENDRTTPSREILEMYSHKFHKPLHYWTGEDIDPTIAFWEKEVENALNSLKFLENRVKNLKLALHKIEKSIHQLEQKFNSLLEQIKELKSF